MLIQIVGYYRLEDPETRRTVQVRRNMDLIIGKFDIEDHSKINVDIHRFKVEDHEYSKVIFRAPGIESLIKRRLSKSRIVLESPPVNKSESSDFARSWLKVEIRLFGSGRYTAAMDIDFEQMPSVKNPNQRYTMNWASSKIQNLSLSEDSSFEDLEYHLRGGIVEIILHHERDGRSKPFCRRSVDGQCVANDAPWINSRISQMLGPRVVAEDVLLFFFGTLVGLMVPSPFFRA